MYCKLFASLYQGTLRGRSNEILVFTNLLAHCTKEGTVDKHFRAIAEETGLSMDDVKNAINVLESPDEESRSPEEGGARIVRMDEHRVWGWKVVNYGKYRSIRSEEDRAEQNRLAQQRWREKHNGNSKQSKPQSAESKHDKPKEREEVDVEGKGEEIGTSTVPSKTAAVTPESFMEEWNLLPPPFPSIRAMSTSRKVNLQARLRDPFWVANWKEALERIKASSFCRGAQGWVANVEFFLRPDSVVKAIEGKYDDPEAPASQEKEVWVLRPQVDYKAMAAEMKAKQLAEESKLWLPE